MDTTTTTADVLADTLRSAAAWLREAAVQLAAGDLDRAHQLARLGTFGCEGLPERIARFRDDQEGRDDNR